MTSLRMSNHYDIRSYFLKHQWRNLSCELSLFLPAHVLCSNHQKVFIFCFIRISQRCIRRDNKELHVFSADILCQLLQLRNKFHSIFDCLIHFGICTKVNLLFCHYIDLSRACLKNTYLKMYITLYKCFSNTL